MSERIDEYLFAQREGERRLGRHRIVDSVKEFESHFNYDV